ncbi:MAG: hypothetical protein M3Q08_03980 [Pseudomonadota bacterium]|nr:hypothetical protein [Pseudomonadota bacterium]
MIHEQIRPLDTWGNDQVQLLSPPERAIVAAYRLRLGLDYSKIADHIVSLRQHPALLGDATISIDGTGLGRPLLSLLRERGFSDFVSVVITSGDQAREVSFDEWRVAKSYLVGGLSAAMSTGKLLAAQGLPDGAELRKQLEDYQIEITSSGHMTANAASGSHDDMVIATALAWFAAEHIGAPHQPVQDVSW